MERAHIKFNRRQFSDGEKKSSARFLGSGSSEIWQQLLIVMNANKVENYQHFTHVSVPCWMLISCVEVEYNN